MRIDAFMVLVSAGVAAVLSVLLQIIQRRF
jgi:hypothetical protein